MKQVLNDWRLWLLASLTLGLAPFFPEPHIWGKLLWVLGGAVGMKSQDWFDLAMHGLPWLLFIRALIISFLKKPTTPA
jgi:hypothetical protein